MRGILRPQSSIRPQPFMNCGAAVLAAVLLHPACLSRTGGNSPPEILYGEVRCCENFWEKNHSWRIRANVVDDDGSAEVLDVFGDFYDTIAGSWVLSVALEPQDESLWETIYDQENLPIDCLYDFYRVDLMAYDLDGHSSTFSVTPLRSCW